MKKRSRLILYAIIAIVLSLLAYRIVSKLSSKSERAARPQASLIVETETVKLGSITKTLSLTGNILPNAQVTLYSQVPGIVEKITVDEGDSVKKGQLIALIDASKYKLQLEQAQAALEMAKVEEENSTKEYKRMKELYEDSAISQQQMDSTEARYRSAQAQLVQANATYGLAFKTYKDCQLTSTINGVVAKRFIDSGELIVASVAPIVTIVDIRKVKISVYVNEEDFSLIKPDLEAKISVDAYPNRVFEGKVSKVGSVIDTSSRKVEAEIAVDNPDRALRPGMFARLELVVASKEGVPVIQYDYASQDTGGYYVFLLNGNVAEKRYIKLGIVDRGLMEVASGLSGGETIVSFGQKRLKDGDKVEVLAGGNK